MTAAINDSSDRRGEPRVMCEIGSGRSPAAAICRRTGEDEPARLTDRQLLQRVTSRQARCAGADVDPDAWFPVATRWQQARAEAAPALALCAACPVRAECLELSMRQWGEAGRHGIWGGLLEVERAAIREQWLVGASVIRLLAGEHEGPAGRQRMRTRPTRSNGMRRGRSGQRGSRTDSP